MRPKLIIPAEDAKYLLYVARRVSKIIKEIVLSQSLHSNIYFWRISNRISISPLSIDYDIPYFEISSLVRH